MFRDWMRSRLGLGGAERFPNPNPGPMPPPQRLPEWMPNPNPGPLPPRRGMELPQNPNNGPMPPPQQIPETPVLYGGPAYHDPQVGMRGSFYGNPSGGVLGQPPAASQVPTTPMYDPNKPFTPTPVTNRRFNPFTF